MRALVRTLLLSGLGMTICGGSHPASQGEHLVSHYLDMFAPATRGRLSAWRAGGRRDARRGRLQERMLAATRPSIRPSTRPSKRRSRGSASTSAFVLAAVSRQGDGAGAQRAADAPHRAVWSTLLEEAARIALPASRIDDVLRRAGAPRRPRRSASTMRSSHARCAEARFLRDRYTFLDLRGGCRWPA
jgi:glycerol-1-phosphate dehydrogenase [NAD(P)+]